MIFVVDDRSQDDNRHADEKEGASSNAMTFFNCNRPTKARFGISQTRRDSNTPDTSKGQSALVGPLAVEASLFGGEGGKV